MKTVQQAWEMLMRLNVRTSPEMTPINKAVNKIAFENVIASCDSPPFSLSRYDGYAMGKNDTTDWYELVTESPLAAGQVFDGVLKPQQALPIMTGAPLPKGTYSILPFEHCEVSEKRLKPLLLEKNERMTLRKGQNFRKGEKYISSGERITPLHVAFLAMDGRPKVKVYSKPHLAVISTGDELSDVADKSLKNGNIRNSHPDTIFSMLSDNGILTQGETVSDAPALMKERFAHHIKTGDDVIITTGGLGKGVRDFTRMTLKETGCFPLFEGIAAWPVGTFSAYSVNEKIVFSLPGGLVSVILLTKLFVEPFLKKIQGWQISGAPGPFSVAELSDISSSGFLNLSVKKKGYMRFVKAYCSHQENSRTLRVTPLTSDSLLKLNAFIVMDSNNYPFNERVKVFTLWN